MFCAYSRPIYQVSVYKLQDHRSSSSNISKNTRPIRTKFYVKLPWEGETNQRTNGPVNAQLISGPRISTKHTKPEKTRSRNDLDLQYSLTFIY